MPIKITSKKDGFRRAGLTHSGTVVYPDEAFTDEQLKTLKAEPLLVVEETSEEPAAQDSSEEQTETPKSNRKGKAAK
jgi:hypothetical protein